LGLGERSSEVLIEVHAVVALVGKVLVAPGETPCREGWVMLHDRKIGQRASGRVHRDGTVELRALLPGRYQVAVHCFDHVAEDHYPPVEVGARPPPPQTWHVRPGLHIAGMVVDGNGAPVGDAAVSASQSNSDPRAQRADGWQPARPDGSFEVTGLLPGDYLVQVMAAAHPPTREPLRVTLAPGRSAEGLRLVLDRSGGVKGVVVDEDGQPVADVEVQANGPSWEWRDGVLTDQDGGFHLDGLRPGNYRVSASRRAWGEELRAPGGGDDDVHGVKVVVKAGAQAHVKLTVERQSGKISGQVTQGGRPVTDAFLDARRESESAAAEEGSARRDVRAGWGWQRVPVMTDLDGRFTLTALAPGKYTIRAYRKGGGEAVAEHVAVATRVALVIRPTGSLSGTVAVASGSPPPEQFEIVIEDLKEGYELTESFWRSGGQWAVRELPAGNFHVGVRAREGTGEQTVSLTEGQARAGIALVLQPRARVRGQVVALESGKPLPGLRVIAQAPTSSSTIYMDPSSEQEGRTEISGTDGRFELADLPVGRLIFFVWPLVMDESDVGFCLARATVQAGQQLTLPPIRCPRRRTKNVRDRAGDLGFSLKELNPMALADPVPLVVAVVRPGGPAAAAGLKAGDVVTSIDGHDVTGSNDYLYYTLSHVPEGTAVSFGVARGGTVSVAAGPPL
jgi:protocatechuate 3,4-dioxygenase beta subunit